MNTKLAMVLARPNLALILTIAIFTAPLAAQGQSSESSPTASSHQLGGNGTFSFHFARQAIEDLSAVYVTIDKVQILANGDARDSDPSWVTIVTPQKTFNLLDLQDGVVEALGEGPLEAGSYSQIGLIIGKTPDASSNIQCHPHPFANYIIDADDAIHELRIPSGKQSGIKIACNGLCEIVENQTTDLILGFDAAAPVLIGDTLKMNLNPTIEALPTEDVSIVSGTVNNSADLSAIGGATVSAETFDPTAVDPADEVTVLSATRTAVDGTYELLLKSGDYSLVAFKEGFSPMALPLTALAGQVQIQDFLLTGAALGGIAGTVTIADIGEATFARVAFLQRAAATRETIEVLSVTVLSGENYTVRLPVGDYSVVSSTCNLPSQEVQMSVIANSETVLDIAF